MAADSETRRLKLTRETVTPQSSVQTDNQQDPPQEDIGRHNRGPAQTERPRTTRQILKEKIEKHQTAPVDRFGKDIGRHFARNID